MRSNDSITGLADAIEALRAELTDAVSRGANQSMRFRIKPVELKIQVAVTKGIDGKIAWNVLGLGAKRVSETAHELHLHLEPVWLTQEGEYSENFTISDQSTAGAHFGRPSAPAEPGRQP